MSLSKHLNATLDGWDGPFYPEPFMQDLGDSLRVSASNGMQLIAFARTIAGHGDAYDRVVTGDGYSWYWMLEFEVQGGSVRVAVPRASNGQWHRSMAVYTKGGVPKKVYAAVVAAMTEQAQAQRSATGRP